MVHIAAGAEHSLAVTDSGELLTWGAGAHGQLGHGRAAIPLDRDEPTPRAVLSVTGEAITHAAAGMLHSGELGLTSCWMGSLGGDKTAPLPATP